jgi:hypothetical protein
MSRQCACGRPTDVVACNRCADRLAELLADIPALVVELDTTIARLGRSGPGGRRGRETPLPYHPNAAEALTHLRSVLSGYAAVIAKERSLPLLLEAARQARAWSGRAVVPTPPATDYAVLAGRWLLNNLQTLRKVDQFPVILDAVFLAHRDGWRACDRAPDRAYAGPCDGLGSVVVDTELPEPCGYDLLADPEWVTVRCRTCGHEYDVALRRQWMLDDLREFLGSAEWVSTAVASCGVKVPAATIRQWKKRGKIQPRDWTVGLTGQPQPLYLVADVIAVAAGQAVDYGTEEAS